MNDGASRLPAYIGLLLHRGGAQIAEVEEALRKVHFMDIQVVNDPELISRLVSHELQRDAEAWLVLYSLQQDASVRGSIHDALVIPFPDSDVRASGNETRALGGYAFRLLEVIRGSIVTPWTPIVGVSNLVRRDSASSPLEPRAMRYQLIHSDTGLFAADFHLSRAVPSPANTEQPDQAKRDIRAAFDVATHEVATLRDRQRARPGDSIEPSPADQHIERVSGQLAEINNRLSSSIVRAGGQRVVPTVVKHYRGVMDPETERFLISSATVAAYVRANPEIARDFDYSLPGSGVCKALEREVKVSLAPHLLRQPRDFTFYDAEEALRSSGKVAQRLHPIVNASTYAFLVGKGNNNLPGRLKVIRPMRNYVAHIDPVSAADFDKLWRECLDPETSPEHSTLGGILEWKRQQLANSEQP